MMKAIVKTNSTVKSEWILQSVLLEAEIDHRQSEQMFLMMGWSDLPDLLKMEIRDDVKGYYNELTGQYSTNDPYVQRRRESVDFWVSSYTDGLCTLETAAKALKVNSI